MKTAISIPDTVFESAEQLAQRMGVSRSELYVLAISKYVHENQNEQITERLNALYDDLDASLAPELTEIQRRSLPQDEW